MEQTLPAGKTRYLLVGGGLAANQAARLIRMKDAEGAITLVSKESELPYDRPPTVERGAARYEATR